MYQDIKFKTKAEFKQWLDETTAYTVDFLDKGQDLLKIWVASNNEILHCNLQASIWNGFVVNKAYLELGEMIHLINPNFKPLKPYDLSDFTLCQPYDFKVCNIEQRALKEV